MNLRSLAVLGLSLLALSAAVAFQGEEAVPSADVLLPEAARGVRYWKGNLHTHSLWSDGDDFPEMIADWYKRHGYHFLAMTDHNVLSEGQRWIDVSKRKVAVDKYLKRFGPGWVEQKQPGKTPLVRLKPLAEFSTLLDEPGRFLMIQGEEITHRYAKSPVHINGINLRDRITPVDGTSVTETIQANHRLVQEQSRKVTRPMLAFLNHPNYFWGVNADDMILAEEMRFFEVYNGSPVVRNYGDKTHDSTERLWDIVNALRLGKHKLPVLYGLATDDAHNYHTTAANKLAPGRGWIMVQAPFLTPEAMLKSMESGDFYASTGVALTEIHSDDKEFRFKIDARPGVKYTTAFIVTERDAPLDSVASVDDKGKKDERRRVYSQEIGKIVATTTSLEPRYQFTGGELYVRARVTSTRLHPNPYAKGDFEMAWTQPVVTANK